MRFGWGADIGVFPMSFFSLRSFAFISAAIACAGTLASGPASSADLPAMETYPSNPSLGFDAAKPWQGVYIGVLGSYNMLLSLIHI